MRAGSEAERDNHGLTLMDTDKSPGRVGPCGPTEFGPLAAADWSRHCSSLYSKEGQNDEKTVGREDF